MGSRGDDQKAILFIAGDTAKPTIVVPTAKPIPECCYILPLFGNSGWDAPETFDEFKQDVTGYFNFYDPNAVLTVDIIIQKRIGCDWVDQEIVTNSDYGIFRPLGDEVINNLNYISLKEINWSKVLVDFGAGVYRIYTNEIDIFSEVNNDCSFEYDLKEFSTALANKTVFFKVTNSGSLGDRFDATKTFAFPANWTDGMRLPGKFGYDTSGLEQTYHKLNSGKLVYTESKRVPNFTFKAFPLSEGPRKYFENELMMADLIEVTDYNRNMANTHIKTPVHGAGEFGPAYSPNTAKASFEVEFTSAYDNNVKKHCN